MARRSKPVDYATGNHAAWQVKDWPVVDLRDRFLAPFITKCRLRLCKKVGNDIYIRDDYPPFALGAAAMSFEFVRPWLRGNWWNDHHRQVQLNLIVEFNRVFVQGGLDEQRAIWHERRRRIRAARDRNRRP